MERALRRKKEEIKDEKDMYPRVKRKEERMKDHWWDMGGEMKSKNDELDSYSDGGVDSEEVGRSMVNSSAVTHRVEDWSKNYDLCAQRVEDLFSEATSANEDAMSRSETDSGDSAHLNWKKNLEGGKEGDDLFDSESESSQDSARWSPARLAARRRIEMGGPVGARGSCDQVFGDEMEMSLDQSSGSVGSDASETPLPIHLARPKWGTFSKRVVSPEMKMPQNAINRDRIEGYRNRKKQKNMTPRERSHGGNQVLR